MTLNYQSTDPLPMSLTAFDLDNIRGILSEPTRYDWFAAVMLRTAQKANQHNMRKIAKEWPDIAAAFLIYHTGTIPESFRDVIPGWESYITMMRPHIFKEH